MIHFFSESDRKRKNKLITKALIIITLIHSFVVYFFCQIVFFIIGICQSNVATKWLLRVPAAYCRIRCVMIKAGYHSNTFDMMPISTPWFRHWFRNNTFV